MNVDEHVFIIAEIGSNHNQDIKRAFELMKIAKDAGADAVKFQSLQLKKIKDPQEITKDDEELFSQIKLEEEWYEQLFDYAKEIDIECISAPTYLEAVSILKNNGAHYMKIASPQTYGFPRMIKEVAMTGLPTIMSTGYCTFKEIARAVDVFQKNSKENNLTLLHCISEYPTQIEHVNLSYMKKLESTFHVPIGYSDHTLGNEAVCAAVAMGAKVIEKHITINRKDKGPDHFFASEPAEFFEMVKSIRNIEKMIGTGKKELTPFEQEFRESVVMYPYTAKVLEKNHIIKEEDLKYYRSNTIGISPWDVEEKVIHQPLKYSLSENQKITFDEIGWEVEK